MALKISTSHKYIQHVGLLDVNVGRMYWVIQLILMQAMLGSLG